jgi:hypothetical protein
MPKNNHISRFVIAIYVSVCVLILVGILLNHRIRHPRDEEWVASGSADHSVSLNDSSNQQIARRSSPFDIEFFPGDTLHYNGYTVIRTSEPVDSATDIYGAAVIKHDSILFNLQDGGPSRSFSQFALVKAIPHHDEVLIIQQFSGGAHCCFTTVILELSDEVHVLFNSANYGDLGYEARFCDFDQDSAFVLTELIIGFDYFGRLCHAQSPFSSAFFTYDPRAQQYVVANRVYAHHLLDSMPSATARVRTFADTTDFSTYSDAGGEYLELVLSVVIDYVYAGEKAKGWDFFDKWYRLPDKQEIRARIQDVFNSSTIYQIIYASHDRWRGRDLTSRSRHKDGGSREERSTSPKGITS